MDKLAFDTPEAEALARLTDLARDRLPPPAPEAAARAAFARFQRGQGERRSRRAIRIGAFVLTGAAACGLLFAVGRAAFDRSLTVSVAGGEIDEGGYVRVQTDHEPTLAFSDGSAVKLARASRLRIAETHEDGARLLLEDGHAEVAVVPHEGARWVFDAGPCRVQVTGTKFDMRWSPATQVLEVSLYKGSVTVKGPPAMAGVPMRAGQRLVMDVRRASARLSDLDETASAPAAETPGAAAPALEPSIPEETPVVPGHSSPARGGGGARKAEPWPARILTGDFRGVIAEAERRGIGDVLRRESAANVMALADAARYAGQHALARRALLQARARFPGSSSAHRAAFLLGRMAEDQGGDLGEALRWYGVYLTDGSDDGFRDEAMGRKMTATLRLHGGDRARPLAEEYLRRYPRGAYANAARSIVQ